jgi:predicted RNase H-like nuclease (RuvC/YqgF family)
MVAKDEELRKLRVKQCLLQDENSDLHEQLDEEQARSDELEAALDNALIEVDEQKAARESAQKEIRTQSREIAGLRVCHLHARALIKPLSANCCLGRA